MSTHPKILFLCTGNYYRSRYAEAVFNHQARARKLPWRAFSRGLAPYEGLDDTLSPHTRCQMHAQGINLDCTGPAPRELTEEDLKLAHRVIALKEAEHRPLMAHLFPAWVDRITYWHVSDLDQAEPSEALPSIEKAVLDLLDELDKDRRTRSL